MEHYYTRVNSEENWQSISDIGAQWLIGKDTWEKRVKPALQVGTVHHAYGREWTVVEKKGIVVDVYPKI